MVTRFRTDRAVMGTRRPVFADSCELRWILTTPESAKLAISSRSNPIACRKELLAKINRSASNLPTARGNPKVSTTWHADIRASYIEQSTERSHDRGLMQPPRSQMRFRRAALPVAAKGRIGSYLCFGSPAERPLQLDWKYHYEVVPFAPPHIIHRR